MEQKPLSRFNAHGGQVFARRNAHGGGEGTHQMAFGNAQPLAELFHAVQTCIVGADILDRGLHQRRQGGGGTVGIGQLAQQRKGQLAAGPAVGGFFSGKAVQQLGGGRTGLAPGQVRQLVQTVQELHTGLPDELDAQQMAAALRGKSQRGTA